MPVTRDGKMWRSQFYYKDWQGVSHKKNKRGFRTKAEAEQWERDFLQQQQRNLDINFENFVEGDDNTVNVVVWSSEQEDVYVYQFVEDGEAYDFNGAFVSESLDKADVEGKESGVLEAQ